MNLWQARTGRLKPALTSRSGGGAGRRIYDFPKIPHIQVLERERMDTSLIHDTFIKNDSADSHVFRALANSPVTKILAAGQEHAQVSR